MFSHTPAHMRKLDAQNLTASLSTAATDGSGSLSDSTILPSGQRRRSDTCLLAPMRGQEMQPNFCSTHFLRLSPTALSIVEVARIQKGEHARGQASPRLRLRFVNPKTTAE